MKTRRDIVKEIMNELGPDDIVVASTGYISREVFNVKDRELNFYMMGSMGCALAFGIGLALNLPNKVIVINGDGSALMGLGTFATWNACCLPNLLHIIIDNGMHESTGGQRTESDKINFYHLAHTPPSNMRVIVPTSHVCPIPSRITLTPKQISERFKNAILRQQKKQKTS